MSVRVYIINFLINSANLYDFEQFLKTNVSIGGYWNYIPLSYCIKSYSDATTLSQQIGQFFPGGNFVVAEINPTNVNGILPAAAWEWFRSPPEIRGGLFSSLGSLPTFHTGR